MDIEKAVALIKQFEGFSPVVYLDNGGVPTIGYGSTNGVTTDSPPISEEEATIMLEHDLRFAINAINRLVIRPLNDNQFAALCSFIYNVGVHAFEGSTMLKLLNNAQYDLCADQFLRWNRAGGKVIQGLTTRREAERALFMEEPDEDVA